MTGKEYKDIIDSFDVENNSNYQPSDDGQTYCNIFAQDVAEECDTPLPTGGCTSDAEQLVWEQVSKLVFCQLHDGTAACQ